jgi:hypothetical protein
MKSKAQIICETFDNNVLKSEIQKHGQEHGRKSLNYTLKQMGYKNIYICKNTMAAIMKRLGFRPDYSDRYLAHCHKHHKATAA